MLVEKFHQLRFMPFSLKKKNLLLVLLWLSSMVVGVKIKTHLSECLLAKKKPESTWNTVYNFKCTFQVAFTISETTMVLAGSSWHVYNKTGSAMQSMTHNGASPLYMGQIFLKGGEHRFMESD